MSRKVYDSQAERQRAYRQRLREKAERAAAEALEARQAACPHRSLGFMSRAAETAPYAGYCSACGARLEVFVKAIWRQGRLIA